MTYEVGDTRRPTLTIDIADGNTVVVLTVTSPSGVVATPALTRAGNVWTASAPYTFTEPQRWVERWVSTNAVTGLGAGAATVELDVDPISPALGPGQSSAFATPTQYGQIIGGTMPDNLQRLLRVASSTIRTQISGAVWDVTVAATAATLAEATCEQVAYAVENGWKTGRPTVTRAVSIGSASLGAYSSSAGGSGAMPELSPVARELLLRAGLLGGAIDDFGWGVQWVS